MPKLMIDGWFKAKHMRMKNPQDDVPLDEGHRFTVSTEAYHLHLVKAIHRNQVSSDSVPMID